MVAMLFCCTILLALLLQSCVSWVQPSPARPRVKKQSLFPFHSSFRLFLAVDDVSNLSNLPDDKPNDDDTPKLGIDIQLDPLTDQEASELMAAATEVVNDAIASGLDDLEELRAQLKEEMVQRQKDAARQSEFKAEQESTKLLSKIDRLTDDFLQKTASSRRSVQQAATADQNAAGKGVEIGSWGTLGGATVRTTTDTSDTMGSKTTTTSPQLIVLADPSSDTMVKQLLDPLTQKLGTLLSMDSDIKMSIHKPTATIPLGGENANCILLFLTSWTDASSVKRALDRCWRTTLDSRPPNQVVVVSTVGTERTAKMPYSMKNLLSGGQLEKRRQMEEAVITMAKQRGSIDYTICKVGEITAKCSTAFAMGHGDTLEGTTTTVDTATSILAQAMIDPRARNTTLSVVGTDPTDSEIDDGFLRLVGPEVWRTTENTPYEYYEAFTEYVTEWATALASSGRGLTTPVRVDIPSTIPSVRGVQKARSVRLLFLPTATGKNYKSKEEERDLEQQQGKGRGTVVPNMSKFNDGGLEFVAELLDDQSTRARVMRCNYGNDVIVKELSEETILSSFRKSIEVWRKQHPL